MPWLVAQLSSLMRRNIGTVKDSSFAASSVEQRIFMTMSLTVRFVFNVLFLFIGEGENSVEEKAFERAFV